MSSEVFYFQEKGSKVKRIILATAIVSLARAWAGFSRSFVTFVI